MVIQFRAGPALVERLLGDEPAPPEAWWVRGFALLSASYVRRGRVGPFLPRETWSLRLAGAELPAPAGGAATVEFQRSDPVVTLTVRRAEEEELHYCGETCAQPSESVFASAREAGEFLDRDPVLAAGKHHTWEPLATRTVRWALGGWEDLEFDSAFRQVALRGQPRATRASAARSLGAPARPLPSP